MSIFKEGTKVSIVGDDHIIRTGTIRSVYETLGTAIVIIDDGNVEKVPFNRMGIVPETETQRDQGDNNEPRTDVKVISKDRFANTICKVVDPENISKVHTVGSIVLVSLAIISVGTTLMCDLFGDKNEIEISREQLAEAVVEHCTPSALVESTGNKMSVSQVFPIALVSGLVLKDIVGILFDESEND